jgi:hypothetical protein
MALKTGQEIAIAEAVSCINQIQKGKGSQGTG